ncbi:MAG: PEP-CTERM sorting domain-containing protein [Phycisphaerae bacterium]
MIGLFAASSAVLIGTAAAAAAPFASGNVVVVRSGNDTIASENNNAAPAYLDEYQLDGTLVQSVPLGDYSLTTAQFTLLGGNHSGGFISKSLNGSFLILPGYYAPVNTPTVAANDSQFVPRTIARIDLNGNIDTSTRITDISANEMRSAASYDGTAFWSNGTGNSNQLRYSTLGASTSTRITTSANHGSRVVNVFWDSVGEAQVGFSRSNGGRSIGLVNRPTNPVPKLPIDGDSAVTNLFSNVSTPNPSPYDFLFIDSSTLYITDDNNAAIGGIQKWTRSGSTWTKQYSLQTDLPSIPLRGLTGFRDGNGDVILVAVPGNGGSLVMVKDLGETSPFTVIATPGTNMTFHDAVYIPEPASLVLLTAAGAVLLRRRRGPRA